MHEDWRYNLRPEDTRELARLGAEKPYQYASAIFAFVVVVIAVALYVTV